LMNEEGPKSVWLRALARLSVPAADQSLLRSAGGLSLVRSAGGGLLFLSQVFLASWMGAEAFGAYSLAWACVAIAATVAGLGMSGTTVRFIAAYEAGYEAGLLQGLLRFCRFWTIIAATILAILGIALLPLWPGAAPYSDPIRLAFIAIPALAILNLDSAIARGFGWMTWSAVAEQIARPTLLMLIGALIAAVILVPRAEHFVAACVAAYAVVAVVQHFIVRRGIATRVAAAKPRMDRAQWIAMSAGVLLLNGSQAIRSNADPLLVGLLLNPVDVGVYTAAMRVATLVAFAMMVAGIAAQPTIAALHSRGSDSDLARFVRRLTRASFIASLALGIMLAVAGRPLLALFGPEFTAGYPVLLVLIAAHVLAASVGPLTSVLVMTGSQGWAAAIHLVSLPVHVALSLLFIPRLGLIGAALAAAFSLALTQLALLAATRRSRRR
jgi:O-antigen/teichoic acid export membrane protein